MTPFHMRFKTPAANLSIGEIKPLSVNPAKPYSTDWFVESAASGVGSLLPFLISGKIMGGAMRGTCAKLGIEGPAASVLTSNRFAQLSGAGIYAGLKRPQEGETRFGNAVATVGAFAVFDAGNSLAGLSTLNKSGVMAFSTRSAIRIGSGLAGGVSFGTDRLGDCVQSLIMRCWLRATEVYQNSFASKVK